MEWGLLVDETAIASVLPKEYIRFARPISDGLVVFLEGLPDAAQSEVLAAQASVPTAADISQRLGLLARCCPVLHKLGQVLARDQRLSPQLRAHLRELESLPPSVPLATIRRLLIAEFGPLDRAGIELGPKAIAEASVAVVMPYRQSSRKERAFDGVLKILKPRIEERLQQELGLLARVGAHLDQRCEELGIPHLDYEESFEQIRDKLAQEVKLEQEQQHLTQAQAFYKAEPRVQIPLLQEHCTKRVTAMQRMTGGKVTDHGLDDPYARRRLAELVIEALLAQPIFCSARRALFHSDPHAGNLLLTADHRLAILDWSLVGSLGERERVAIVQMILAALSLDTQRIISILASLAERGRMDLEALKSVVQDWLQRVRRGHFPGMAWLIGMLDQAVERAGLRVGSDLMLFRKTLHTLEGVVAEIGDGPPQIDRVISREFLYQFATEWPRRWWTAPSSRAFATRLSNLDLTKAVFNYPSTMRRFWMGLECEKPR